MLSSYCVITPKDLEEMGFLNQEIRRKNLLLRTKRRDEWEKKMTKELKQFVGKDFQELKRYINKKKYRIWLRVLLEDGKGSYFTEEINPRRLNIDLETRNGIKIITKMDGFF